MRLLIFLFAVSLPCLAAEPSIIKNPKSLHSSLKIVSEDIAADGSSARLVLDCPDGIFSFDVDLGQAKFTTLTFVVKNTEHWEGVEFKATGKDRPKDLKTTAGATIKADGKDCVITLTGEALDLFKTGGRFQFINLYRG